MDQTTQWLALLSYSAKYGISLSTLRRRIKNQSISFKQENGKYFIEDDGVTPRRHDNALRQGANQARQDTGQGQLVQQSQQVQPNQNQNLTNQANVTGFSGQTGVDSQVGVQTGSRKESSSNVIQPGPGPTFVEASVFTSANRLVEELKAAYAKILQEKEEQITQLKEEIVDLRMLVRIMEQQAAPRSNTKRTSDDIFFGDITLKDL